MPASCATDAFAAATRFAAISCWARMGKGAQARIAFDDNQPMGDSNCVSCGECMVSCPTGALTNKLVVATALPAAAGSESVPPDELQALPVFQATSPAHFLTLNRRRGPQAPLPPRRNHLPRGRIRLDGVLHSRRQGSRVAGQPHRPRENTGGRAGIFQQAHQRPRAAGKKTAATKKPTGARFPSMLRSISPTTIQWPNSARATSSAK